MALAAVTLFAAGALRRQRLGAEISPLSADTAAGQYTRSGSSLSLRLQGSLRLQAGAPYDQTAEVAGVEVRILKTISRTAGGAGTLTSPIVQVFTLVH